MSGWHCGPPASHDLSLFTTTANRAEFSPQASLQQKGRHEPHQDANDMRPAFTRMLPNYILQNRHRAEFDQSRGIPHLHELNEALDGVNIELAMMHVGPKVRTGRRRRLTSTSRTRMGAPKASVVVPESEVDRGESSGGELSSVASSEDESEETESSQLADKQSHAMRNPPTMADSTNSFILNLLKNKVQGLSTRAHVGPRRWPGGNRFSGDQRTDNRLPKYDSKLFNDMYEKSKSRLTTSQTQTKNHGDMLPPSRGQRKALLVDEDDDEEPEIDSQYTEIDSPQDTLVDTGCGADQFERNSRIDSLQFTAPFAKFALLTDSTFGRLSGPPSEHSPRSDAFEETDTVIVHDVQQTVKFDVETPRPSKPASPKHRRNVSTASSVSNGSKPSIPPRARSRTNEGMLELKIGTCNSTTTFNTPERRTHQHRRKISLGLPINIRPSHPQLQHSGPSPAASRPMTPAVPENAALVSAQQERELEYKHRHTFIGTASLDDFLEILELTPIYITSNAKVAKAFVHLASTEQVLARQFSSQHTGWELVARITPEIATGTASGTIDYLAQAHVKLGSVTLRQFLELVQWDERDETGAMGVVEAFCAASHLDGRAREERESKAKAFRSWMLRQ